MRGFVAGGAVTAAALAITLLGAPGQAGANGPEAGGYLGAAFPVGHYSDTVEIGGVVGGYGGGPPDPGGGGGLLPPFRKPQITHHPTHLRVGGALPNNNSTRTCSF